MQIEKLTDSEEIVMRAIWDIGGEPVLSDVVTQTNDVYGKDWKPQTVSTFLTKLCSKHYVKLQRNGKIYPYKIIVPKADYKRMLYQNYIKTWNHDNAIEFIREMMENGDVSKEELRNLL